MYNKATFLSTFIWLIWLLLSFPKLFKRKNSVRIRSSDYYVLLMCLTRQIISEFKHFGKHIFLAGEWTLTWQQKHFLMHRRHSRGLSWNRSLVLDGPKSDKTSWEKQNKQECWRTAISPVPVKKQTNTYQKKKKKNANLPSEIAAETGAD